MADSKVEVEVTGKSKYEIAHLMAVNINADRTRRQLASEGRAEGVSAGGIRVYARFFRGTTPRR